MKLLQFSGGKDSLACLYLLRPQWDEITVAWVNTGKAFPETEALMARVADMVPDFRVIHSDQNIEEAGYPVDLLPVDSTPLGRALQDNSPMRLQGRYACCAWSLWRPMESAMKAWGVTEVIRGTKASDRRHAPMLDGQVVNGVTYHFPLIDWTDAQVMAYLAEIGAEVPANYALMGTGLDCWNCTAYLDENRGRLEYMSERHPHKHAHVAAVLAAYRGALERVLPSIMETAHG